MKKLLAVMAPLIAAAALFSAGSANAVIGGQFDGSRHPYVGDVVFYYGARPVSLCSGSLLSPTVFLTAAHCALGPGGLVATSAKIWFSPTVSPCSPTPFPCQGADATATAPDAIQLSPGAASHATDLAVIKLDTPVRDRDVAVLAPAGALDALAAHSSRPLGIAGYGGLDPFSLQTRTFGLVRLLAPSIPGAPSGYAALFEDPAFGTVACHGDSGGPLLFGPQPVVFGVISAIDPDSGGPCPSGTLISFRTDTPQALAFLAQFGVGPQQPGDSGDRNSGDNRSNDDNRGGNEDNGRSGNHSGATPLP